MGKGKDDVEASGSGSRGKATAPIRGPRGKPVTARRTQASNDGSVPPAPKRKRVNPHEPVHKN